MMKEIIEDQLPFSHMFYRFDKQLFNFIIKSNCLVCNI